MLFTPSIAGLAHNITNTIPHSQLASQTPGVQQPEKRDYG